MSPYKKILSVSSEKITRYLAAHNIPKPSPQFVSKYYFDSIFQVMIAQTSEQLKELMQFRERTTKKSMNIRKYIVHLLSETLRLS